MVVNTTINIRTASDHCTAWISAETTDKGDDEGENDGVGNGKHYEFVELSTAGDSLSQVVVIIILQELGRRQAPVASRRQATTCAEDRFYQSCSAIDVLEHTSIGYLPKGSWQCAGVCETLMRTDLFGDDCVRHG